jgi:hypothetical protein
MMIARRRHVLSLAVLLLGVVAVPAPAQAGSFGADLSLPANGDRTCRQGLFPDPSMAAVVGVQHASCTWWSAGSLMPGAGDALVPRGGGMLRRVRVKVGPVTGRMQVLVLRQRRHVNLGTAACCFYVAATPVFTPAPNEITELETNIPVRNDYDPASGLENFDLLVVSSLDPDVPVPSWLGGSGYAGGAIGGVFPHWEPGVEQRPDYGMVTFGQVLVAGDVDPAPEIADERRGGDPPPPAQPRVVVGNAPTLGTRGGRVVRVRLACSPALPCEGVLRLQSRRAGSATGRKVSYGHTSFVLDPGEVKRVRVALTSAARRRLRARAKVTAYANVTLEGRNVASARITLRR